MAIKVDKSKQRKVSVKSTEKKKSKKPTKSPKESNKESEDEIIKTYIDNLDKQLKEKDLYAFWTFPDRSGFKKFKFETRDDMQEFINQNINKYKNRIICKLSISTYKNFIGTGFTKYNIQIMLNMDFYNIDDKGVIKTKGAWGGRFVWEKDDLKITKFTWKFVEKLLIPGANDEISYISFTGYPIHGLLKDLKRLKIDMSDVLHPLAGL
jgi:hypothetical protein